ncbi:DUF2490 domain-containing protein [Litoribacter populi]|uniref:DUF2490 domain-containing protein n=1 Tax=Litoribacter populi TaxID=2598460 RepID=UPI00117E3840|nr:DUF2490 domain-containing protein [Litoribacter populi]
MRGIYKKIVLCLFISFTSLVGYGQEMDFESGAPTRRMFDERMLYTKWIVTNFLTEDKTWFWYTDVVYRRQSGLENNNLIENPLRFSVRPFFARQFGRFTRVHLNPIGLFVSDARLGQPTDLGSQSEYELRSTLEITQDAYVKKAGKEWINITHRWRFESRWRGVVEPIGPDWNFRTRYRTRFRIPLNGKHFYDNNVFYTVNYHELHLEFGPGVRLNQFSQNRNFFGVGYRFWDWARIDIGYLHQYNFRGDGMTIDMSRGPMFYLFIDYLSKLRIGRDKPRL